MLSVEPRGCLLFVIVVFPDHTHLLFLTIIYNKFKCVQRLLSPKILVINFWVRTHGKHTWSYVKQVIKHVQEMPK